MSDKITISPNQLQQLIEHAVSRGVSMLVTTRQKEWVTLKEAAELCNCSVSKVNQLIEAGELIASNKGVRGATVSISRSSINKYHSARIYNPTSWKK